MPTFEDALSDDSVDTLPDDPATGGQVAGEGAAEGGVTPNYLDIDSNRDALVKVTVNGEELEGPLGEALNGYSRTADYTRKTQELAAERQTLEYARALATAYERNPQETVRLLANSAGLTLAEARAQVQDAQAQAGQDDWLDDPVDPRLSMLEQRIQQFEVQNARSELERTIGSLQQRYGADFNPSEVVNAALAAGTTDLEGVYKQLAFDRVMARRQAVTDAEAKRTAAEAQATAGKAAIGGITHSGSSGASAGDVASTTPRTIADAFALAEAEHGWTFS